MKLTGKVINQNWGGYVFEFDFGNWTIDPVLFSRIPGGSIASVGDIWEFDCTKYPVDGYIPNSANKVQ